MEYFWWYLVILLEGSTICIANIITTVIFWRRRSALKRAAYLLINLAPADILVGLVVISIGATGLVVKTFFMDELEADIFIVFFFLGSTASICSLAVIAVERAFAITKPMRHRTAPTAYYWRGLSLIWITAALTSTFMDIRGFLSHDLIVLQYAAGSIWLVLLLVICLSYCSILWATLKRSPALGQRDLQNGKLAKTLFIVTFFSLATVIPGVTATIIPKGRIKESIHFDGFFALLFFEFSNSLINPFLYALRMPEFRREFKRLCAGLTVNWPLSREEVIPMADVGARGPWIWVQWRPSWGQVFLRGYRNIHWGAAENNTLTFVS